jgi:hypothetical protein
VKEIDAQLQLAIQHLLSHGSIDGPDRTPPPVDWTVEKEELFLKCSAHARDCRKRKSQTLDHKLRAFLQGIKPADPRNAEYIKWVLELPGKHLSTEEDRASFSTVFDRLFGDKRVDQALRQSMRESVEKCEWMYAALFSLIGQHVRTPHGTGRLLAVFAEQCEIRQDGSDRTYRVPPYEVHLDGCTSAKVRITADAEIEGEKCHGLS